jgi:hypothetical protein
MSKNLVLACPSVSDKRIDAYKSSVQNWLRTPSLNKLVQVFGEEPPKNVDLLSLANWYLRFSECWDFRGRQNGAYDMKVGEGARWLLSNDDLLEEQRALALSAAFDLGLCNNDIPSRNEFDYVWVLGGAKLSCLLRSRLAARTIQQMTDSPKAVVLLASTRPIGDAERDATNTYAPDAQTEFDLFVAAAETEFCVSSDFEEECYNDNENVNSSWIIRKYPTTSCNVFVIAAPSSEPDKRRANSADTYEFFFERFNVSEGSSILLTTSQIYVPYQHTEAVRTIAIPHNIYLDTIGFLPEWGGKLQGMNEPSNYLQEIRSTIQAINRFLASNT